MVQIIVTTDELEEQQQDNPLKEMVCGGHRPLLQSEWLFSSFAFWQWILVTVNNAKCNQQKNKHGHQSASFWVFWI